MGRLAKLLSRSVTCFLCAVLIFMMNGCKNEIAPDAGWTPPSSTAPTQGETINEEFIQQYIDNKLTNDKLFEDLISDIFAGFEYVTTKKVLIDNTLAFGEWNDKTSILHSLDDTVRFACTQTGDFGISKSIVVDPSKPVYINLSAEFDPELYKVHINAFASNSFVTAKIVSNGMKQYELDVSASSTQEILLIISATGREDNLGQPITISAVNVWQNDKKLSVVGNVDDDKETGIVDGANLTNTPYYVAPDGTKYQLQVTADGSLSMVPVVPSKALFVGNSLLIGFGFGMAASDSQHDYYYLVNQAISEQNAGYSVSKISGTNWEKATSIEEQNAFLENTLLPKLDEDLELVVIQLGDNVNTDEKLAIFAEGSRRLLEYVRTNCPKARVVWVGAWYQTDAKQEQMKEACEQTGCTFIDIRHLATADNKNSVGNTYTDEKGNQQTITSAGVASHPNDTGFKAIANLILYKLGIVDVENYYA